MWESSGGKPHSSKERVQTSVLAQGRNSSPAPFSPLTLTKESHCSSFSETCRHTGITNASDQLSSHSPEQDPLLDQLLGAGTPRERDRGKEREEPSAAQTAQPNWGGVLLYLQIYWLTIQANSSFQITYNAKKTSAIWKLFALWFIKSFNHIFYTNSTTPPQLPSHVCTEWICSTAHLPCDWSSTATWLARCFIVLTLQSTKSLFACSLHGIKSIFFYLVYNFIKKGQFSMCFLVKLRSRTVYFV